MGRKRSNDPRRNSVAVRFTDEEMSLVTGAAEREHGQDAEVSPWVRSAAVEKARRRKPAKSADGAG